LLNLKKFELKILESLTLLFVKKKGFETEVWIFKLSAFGRASDYEGDNSVFVLELFKKWTK